MSDRSSANNSKDSAAAAADSSTHTTSTTTPNKRRSSFAGETFANLFGANRRSSMSRGSNSIDSGNASMQQSSSGGQQQSMGPITSAATNARRLSMGTFNNLSTSPPQSNSSRREGSAGLSGSNADIEESAVEDEPSSASIEASPLHTTFSRRMSSSTRALRDVRSSMTGGVSGASASTDAAAGSPKEGFNWSDNFRTRAERTSSIAAANPPNLSSGMGTGSIPAANASTAGHGRTKSVAVMDSSPVKSVVPPHQESAKIVPPKERPRPDHFQERILKGDFYMD